MGKFNGVITAARTTVRTRFSEFVVGCSLATVALATGFISYTHISALTQSLGQSWKTAHLMPLAVDGQIVIGSVYFMENEGHRRRWLGLIGFLPGVLESLFANWQSGIAHGLLAAGWATVPAQAFACSTFLFERWLHSRRGRLPAAATSFEQQAVPAVLAAPPVPEPAAPAAPARAAGEHTALAPEVPAPAEPAFPGVPVVGPLMHLAARPAPARQRPRVTAQAAPDGARPPLPSGEELRMLLADSTVTARELSRRYDITRYAANEMKNKFKAGTLVIEEEASENAA
jgi:hypothetical protein